MTGQFPLLVGYYHHTQRQLLLVPAGLHSVIDIDGVQHELDTGIPPGTFEQIHATQHSFSLTACECSISGAGGKLKLMLCANDQLP